MAFSNIAIEQREKEEKALKSFLWLYLVGSVVLHIVALVIGVIVPWNRVLAPEEEPLEVTMVEPLPQEAPKQETQPVAPSPQPATPLKQPLTETPPEKVEQRQPRPTEARKPVEQKAVSPSASAPTNRAAQNNQPATTAREPQAPSGGSVNPFQGLSGAGSSGQGNGVGAGIGTGIEAGSGGSGTTGSGQGTGTGIGSGSGTGSGQGTGSGTGIGFGTGTGAGTGSGSGTGSGQGTGTGAGSGSGTAGSRAGGRAGASIGDNVSLEGIRQEATAVVRDGKVVDFKFQSTGDAELDSQIRRQLDKFKKKVRLPSNAQRDGEVRTNVNFGQSRSLKQSRQAQRYIERQTAERREQTTRQSASSNSSTINQGVDATTTYRRSGSTTYTPRTSTPVRKRVRKTQSTYNTPSVRGTSSTNTPERRTPVRVRKVQPTYTPPVQSDPSTTAPDNAPSSGSE